MNYTNESIFISALRGLVKSLFVVIGIAIGIFCIVLGLSLIPNNLEMPEKSEMKISADANWDRKLLSSSTPVLLKIDIEGVIGTLDLQGEKFKNLLLDSRSGVLAKDRVKGILLYVNTPGGTATDSSTIYHLLKAYKEKYSVPIFAFVDGMCASGGMYISSSADQIYATPDSIVGSVGVRLGPTFNFSQAMEKIGVGSLTLTEGKNKDALNPFRPWKEGEAQPLQAALADEYNQFVGVVTQSRKQLDKNKLINEYGANVFAASKAMQLGYIDHVTADYNEALTALAKAANIEGSYQVVDIRPYQSVLKNLTENTRTLFRGKVEHVFPTGAFTTSDMSGKILYLYQP
jgi:protease IV